MRLLLILKFINYFYSFKNTTKNINLQEKIKQLDIEKKYILREYIFCSKTMIDIFFAFLEGVALIFSPCILPILPILLSSSVSDGKMKPYGIITGFVLSFVCFILFSRYLFSFLNIDPSVIRYISYILLILMGLILLSEHLSNLFAKYTSFLYNVGGKYVGKQKSGYVSGLVIGCLIGITWAPCSGPILASVFIQIIRQTDDIAAYLIVTSFAIGVAVPMLIITLASKKIIGKVRLLSQHTGIIRKIFGILIVCSVLFSVFPSFYSSKEQNTQTTDVNSLQNGIDPYNSDEIIDISSWVNSNPLKIADLKGKVVLIDFWTYSCINCIRSLPHIQKWHEQYKDKDLVVIGIHSPEFEFERNLQNVENAIKQFKITYPVALDNNLSTFTNFKNRYWPAHYLINKDGQVVYTHFGEGSYDITENNIRYLLGLNKENITDSDIVHNEGITHETYLGTSRRELFTSDYSNLLKNYWSIQGKWNHGNENITSQSKNAKLKLYFNAKKVFLVMGGNGVVEILINGKKPTSNSGKDVQDGKINVTEQRLYEIVNNENVSEGYIEITTMSANLKAYAFTFE